MGAKLTRKARMCHPLHPPRDPAEWGTAASVSSLARTACGLVASSSKLNSTFAASGLPSLSTLFNTISLRLLTMGAVAARWLGCIRLSRRCGHNIASTEGTLLARSCKMLPHVSPSLSCCCACCCCSLSASLSAAVEEQRATMNSTKSFPSFPCRYPLRPNSAAT